MKKLTDIFKMFFLLFWFAFVGCGKESDAAPEEISGIEAGELLDYYIAAEHTVGANKVVMLYFTNDGGKIKAHGHVQGGYQIIDIVVKNSAFSIDFYGDGILASNPKTRPISVLLFLIGKE